MFNKDFVVKIRDYLNNEFGHNPEEGEAIANYIIDNYQEGSKLILDFSNVSTINTAFANMIFDAVCKKYNRSILQKYFIMVNYNELIDMTIKKVIENIEEG